MDLFSRQPKFVRGRPFESLQTVGQLNADAKLLLQVSVPVDPLLQLDGQLLDEE
jgi:hypothetical protein